MAAIWDHFLRGILTRGQAFLPFAADGDPEAEFASGPDPEGIADEPVLLLAQDGAPIPGQGGRGDPGLHRERLAQARGLVSLPDDAGGIAVELEAGSRDPGHEPEMALRWHP